MPLTPATWLEEFTVNLTTANNQSNPRITHLADGNILVVWDADDAGVGDDFINGIFGQMFNPLGERIGDEFRVNNSFNFDGETNPGIAPLPTGGFLTVYEHMRHGFFSVLLDVQGANGTVLSVNSPFSDSSENTAPDGSNPRVAVSSDTSALVVWQETEVSGDSRIVGKIYNPTTGELGSEISVINTPGQNTDPAIAVLGNGNYVIAAAVQQTSGNVDDYIAFRLLNQSGGNALGVTHVASTDLNGSVEANPSVTALTGGGFVIAWTGFNGGVVRAQVYSAAGVPQGSEISAGSSGSGTFEGADVVALGDGGFMIFVDVGSPATIRGDRYDSSGQAVSSIVVASGAASGKMDAELLADGRVAVTFVTGTGEIGMKILDIRDAPNAVPVYTDGWNIGTVEGDTIVGMAANDTIAGGDGDDDLTGGDGDDTIFGGEGDDTIRTTGFGDNDVNHGGDGDDTFIFSNTFYTGHVYGDAGDNDHADFSAYDGFAISVDLTLGTYDDGLVRDMTGIEHVTGGNSADVLIGSVAANRLIGNAGDDTIDGGGGDDTIEGGAGGDTLDGGAGDNDTLSYANSDDGVSVDLSGSNEPDPLGGHAAGDTISNFENVTGSSHTDDLLGTTGANTLRGGGGGDRLNGLSGLDRIFGEAGNDRIDFLDTFTTLPGSVLDGGADDDTLVIFVFGSVTSDLRGLTLDSLETLLIWDSGGMADIQFDAEDLLDNFQSIIGIAGEADRLSIFLDGETNLDLSVGRSFTNFDDAGDVISIVGDDDGETITGSAFADIVDGGGGDDTIDGGGGTDVAVYSGAWKDYRVTKAGNVFTVLDLRAGSPDGTDTVENVETLRFSNGDFAIGSTLRDAPTATAIASKTAKENVAFSFNASAHFSDADVTLGDKLTYSMTGAPSWLAIDAASGVLSGKPGFSDAAGARSVTIKATDIHGASASKAFSLTVTDTNRAPVITSGGIGPNTSISVKENTTAVTTITATDPDLGATRAFSLSGVDAARFQISSAGVLTFRAAPDFEKPGDRNADNVYGVNVIVKDNGGLTDTQALVVTVIDANDRPAGPALSKAIVKENLKAGATVGTLSVADQDGPAASFKLTKNPGGFFKIVGNTLQTTKKLDFEKLKSHAITVEATDPGGLKTTKSFTIKVGDVVDVITGTSKKNTLTGAKGADDIRGLGGKDKLFGLGGKDSLDGGAGNDRLEGGTGADTLVGGTGGDKFVFKALADSTVKKAGRDAIADFSRAQGDVIDVSGIDAKAASKKSNQKFDFIGKEAFTKAAGELRFDTVGKKTFVYGDVTGDGQADFVIELGRKIALIEADFVL